MTLSPGSRPPRTGVGGSSPSTGADTRNDRYSRWFSTPISGISTASLLPAWAILIIVLSATVLAAVAIGRLTGLAPGLAVGTALMALGLLLIRGWLIAIARVHAYLLARPQLGDAVRVAVLVASGAALVVAVVGAFAAIAIGSTLLARLWRDIATGA